eukprot:CCRYP_019090-RA/>CCRYP_019090-RA protein AED:0.10 eAED:0.10 QI:0/0.75/0.6/1/1/1/5/427/833
MMLPSAFTLCVAIHAAFSWTVCSSFSTTTRCDLGSKQRPIRTYSTALHSQTQILEFIEPTTGVPVKLIGAMHYNPASIKLTTDVINALHAEDKLGSIIIESCDLRWNATLENDLVRTALQSEMRAAHDLGLLYKRPVVLGDQRINITVDRLTEGAQEAIMDLFQPIGGWGRLFQNINEARKEAVPLGDKYLGINSFVDPDLLFAAPVSLVKYPLSYMVKSPFVGIVVLSLVILLGGSEASDASVFSEPASASDLFVSAFVSFLETVVFARIFLKELLAERNEVLAKNILEQCKNYQPGSSKGWTLFQSTTDKSDGAIYARDSVIGRHQRASRFSQPLIFAEHYFRNTLAAFCQEDMPSTPRDEEEGRQNGHHFSTSTVDDSSSDDDDEQDFPRDGFKSLALNETSFNTQASENEMKDQVSELASLLGDNGGRASPITPSYGSAVEYEPAPRRLMHQRTLSDESVSTVAALPDMVLRAHSVSTGNRGGFVIRYSTPKIALRAAQLERRAYRGRIQNLQPLVTQPSPSPLGKECYWLDIETVQRSSDELYEFLKQLRLPKFFDSVLSDPTSWTSDVSALKFSLLAIFQILPMDADSNEITYVALLSMPRLLVTFSTYPQRELISGGLYQLTSQFMRQRERIPEPTNTGLLLAWLQFHVQRTSRAIRELRAKTLELDESLDRDFIHFDFQELVEVKNCLLRVLSVAEEQHGTIEALAGAEGGTEGLDFSNCQGVLSVLRATASSNERLSSRIDKHLSELRERIMANREDTLNRRLGLLTILSSIFMPLTLLSGIWGMNFDSMPELSMQGAYQKALLGMLLLSLSLLYSFHRAGWTE